MNGTAKPYGIVGEFTTAAAVLHAAEKVRDAGFRRWDVFTPFPVHGMDRAMGLRNSKVGWFAFLGGVTGYTTEKSEPADFRIAQTHRPVHPVHRERSKHVPPAEARIAYLFRCV